MCYRAHKMITSLAQPREENKLLLCYRHFTTRKLKSL